MMTDYSSKTIETRRQQKSHLRVLKENYVNTEFYIEQKYLKMKADK